MFDTAGYLEHLADPGGQLDVAQANATEDWQKLPGNLNEGYTADTHWLRLTLDVDKPLPGGWMLHLSNALLDDVRVYIERPNGWLLLGHSGENVSRHNWPVDYRSAVIPFEPIEPGQHTVLVRLESKNSLASRLEIWQRLAFDDHSRREGLLFGLHFGFYLLLIGLHAIFWIGTRTPMSGLFFLYISLSLLNEVLSLGLIQQISGLPVAWSDRMLGIGFACNLLVGFRVSMQQLGMPTLYPRSSLWLDHFIKVVAAFCLVMALLNNYALSVVPVLLLGMVMIVGFSAVCAYLMLRGYRHARFFALTFGIFYSGLIIGFLRNLGYLPINPWTEHSTTIATMLHLILLSLWLIGRHERKRRAHERWQANLAANMAREHGQRLARKVEQRTKDLREEIQRRELLEQELRKALELEQRLRTEQHEFVAMVSHEVRTPLAIITTLAQRLEHSLASEVPKNTERCQQIRDAASRLLVLVDEYLNDDRMSEAQIELTHSPCDLAALLAELSDDFTPGRIHCRIDYTPSVLLTDASLLRIALRNLLANADRHAPDNDRVDIHVHQTRDSLCIDIRNNGANISDHEREQLFRKYFRGQNTQHSPGAGLGLYLVKRISKMLGGDISLQTSADEQSACFRLRLPLTPVAEASRQ